MTEVSEDAELFQTFEQLQTELEAAEQILGQKFGLPTENLRATLITLYQQNRLDGGEIVEHWLELYTVYANWLKYNQESRP